MTVGWVCLGCGEAYELTLPNVALDACGRCGWIRRPRLPNLIQPHPLSKSAEVADR